MEIVNLSLPATNRFATSYLQQTGDIQSFFHYRFDCDTSDLERLAELKERAFPRQAVANHIKSFMERFPSSPSIRNSLQKLSQNDSVVVIGGQQAGILTGPLYTLHKVITIIKLAEEKERSLNVPVVPVFWIAGEDHDYQEVNHVYVPSRQKIKKWVYPGKVVGKKMVSDIELDREAALSWVQNLISTFGETGHTKKLLSFLGTQLERSRTMVDFFANIIIELFKDYGLLLIDSGDPNLRKLETDCFIQQITHHAQITAALSKQQAAIQSKGYPIAIEASGQAANLFYYDSVGQERILLEFDREREQFTGKNGRISFSMEELIAVAEADPGKLSNNVVTRPLTQEWLFPTLAFIAGPGEIAYWAELKLVFEHFGIKLPPIVPRLNITLLDRSVESDLKELHLSITDILSRGTMAEQEKYLSTIKDPEMESIFRTTMEQLKEQYLLIEEKTATLDKGLLPLLKKNENIVLGQLEFIKKKLEDSVNFKHQVILDKFRRIELALRPNGSPQERIWNVCYYLNQYGMDLIHDLMALNYTFDGTHKVIER